jgi:hypothetical protein
MRLQAVDLEHARVSRGVANTVAVGESIWIDQEGFVSDSRAEPDQV